MHKTLQALAKKRWNIRLASKPALCLPKPVSDRYRSIPDEVTSFLLPIEEACNAQRTVWFLSAMDYARPAGDAFRWNEYEHMELESESDETERAAISGFWDIHFPFMLAVHSDYDYLAVKLSPIDFGMIVHGYAPFWREPTIIAPSFDAFLNQLERSTRASRPKSPYAIFI